MRDAKQLYARKFDDTDKRARVAKELIKLKILHPDEDEDHVGEPSDHAVKTTDEHAPTGELDVKLPAAATKKPTAG